MIARNRPSIYGVDLTDEEILLIIELKESIPNVDISGGYVTVLDSTGTQIMISPDAIYHNENFEDLLMNYDELYIWKDSCIEKGENHECKYTDEST